MSQNQRRWTYVKHIRIARVPKRPELLLPLIPQRTDQHYPSIPYTIEMTLRHLLKARQDFKKEHKELPDFEIYLHELINNEGLHPVDRIQMRQEILQIIDQSPAQTWYKCRACSSNV